MRTLIAVGTVILAACAQAQTQVAPPRVSTQAATVYLIADIPDVNATKCGGTFNGTKLTDVALQTTAPKCKIDVTSIVKSGTNTWIACNSATDTTKYSEGCATTALTFTYTPPVVPTPLQPPTNMRVQQ